VDPVDPATFLAVITTVLVITIAATLRPARSAASLDPLDVIKSQ
jgi:ABC-type lipoprotein release transport system permease subunit